MNVKAMLELLKLTRGRVDPKEVFSDFVAMAANRISISFDPVHREARADALAEVLRQYTEPERAQLEEGFRELARHYERLVDQEEVDDLLGRVYQELGMTGKNGVEFTPYDTASLVSKLTFAGKKPVLPKEGYFTLLDPACGSGNLLLASLGELCASGYNICQHVVAQATDINISSVYMCYVQLSFHAVPAVVIHGNTLSLEEYDRWYTPTYIFGKWVWRCPMPFGTTQSLSDELLKMADEPMYGIIRQMEWGLWPSEAAGKAGTSNGEEDTIHGSKRKA